MGTITLGPEFGVPSFIQPDYLEPGSEGPGLIDIVITCSEDTTVCVLALPTATGSAHALTAVCNHISSVRAVAVWGTGTPGGPQDPQPGLTAHVVSAGAGLRCTASPSWSPQTPAPQVTLPVMSCTFHPTGWMSIGTGSEIGTG